MLRPLTMRGLPLLLAVAIAAPARAQDPAGGPGVCVLSAGEGGRLQAVRGALQSSLEPRAEAVDVRWVTPHEDLHPRCGRLAVAVGRRALRAALARLPDTPLVFAGVSTPETVVAGRDDVAGVSLDPDPEEVLGTLRRLSRGARRVGAVYDPRATGAYVRRAGEAARTAGLTLEALPAGSIGEALRALRRFEAEAPVDALWLLPDPTTTGRETVRYALELAERRRIPVIGLSRWYVEQGAAFARVVRPESMGRRAAEVARARLAGEPVDPVVFSPSHRMLYSRRTARRLGLELPPDLLQAAEEVGP